MKVSCSGSLNRKLKDFFIHGVDEFSKNTPKKPLSGNMVPFISKENYNKYANEILEKYYYPKYPEARLKPVPIDVDELANNMGLNVINTSISKDGGVFGQIFFADANVKLYNNEKEEYEIFNVKKDTILVDTEATYLRSYGSRNMTIAHECIHSYYHRNAFYFAKIFNENLKYIECQVDGTMKNAESDETAMWMEIQANGLAPYILMPEESFSAYAKNLFDLYKPNSTVELGNINQIVDELANAYKVTIYAARKRLIDLGYEQAIGSYNWVDGRYIRPYTFKKGSLNYNETYTISYKDIYSKVLNDSTLAIRALSSYYVFVENHLCINHPDYVEKDINGNLVLSMYALTHMDECCVKFKFSTNDSNINNTDLGALCYLCRDTSKEIEFDLEIVKDQKKAISNPTFDVRFRIHKDNVAEIKKEIIDLSFGEIIKYLMSYLDVTIKELEIDSGINERTIRRYINGENKIPDKRTVVALLRALNLPPDITNIATKQAGIAFVNNNKEDDALIASMQILRGCSVRDANNFMRKLGFEPLTKDE